MKFLLRQLGGLILFSIAMGFLEAAVVIYLRRIYYPEGFVFPLRMMDVNTTMVELLREAATVVMLGCVGILAGRSFNQRFASFLIAFSIWDIFYYVFLKILIQWPESLFTWDILFLIPVPWVGPVLAPCLISLTMLVLAAVMYYRDFQNEKVRLSRVEWSMLVSGSLVVVLSWTLDYFQNSPGPADRARTLFVFNDFIPQSYRWWMFLTGEMLLLIPPFLFWKRTKTLSSIHPG